MKKIILIISVIFILYSCSDNKDVLINEYHKIYSIIKEKNFEKTYDNLDSQSQEYLSFLVDTSNWEFNKIREFGEANRIEFTTLEYYYHLNTIFKGEKPDKLILLELFGVSGVPLFNWFKEPRLLEEKTENEEGDIVIIGYDINEKMCISSKVTLNENQNGEYKLNIFSLFKMNENILKQQFRKYKRLKKEGNSNISDKELIEHFFKEKDKSEYQLEKIRVRRRL